MEVEPKSMSRRDVGSAVNEHHGGHSALVGHARKMPALELQPVATFELQMFNTQHRPLCQNFVVQCREPLLVASVHGGSAQLPWRMHVAYAIEHLRSSRRRVHDLAGSRSACDTVT